MSFANNYINMYNELIQRSQYQFSKELSDVREIRDHFIFKFDVALEKREVDKYNARIQDIDFPEKKDNIKLCILKMVKDRSLMTVGELHVDSTKPLDTKKIADKCGVLNFDEKKLKIFHEPASKNCIDHSI